MISIELDGSIVFELDRPDAKRVELVGAFHGWHEQRLPMTRSEDGLWRLRLELDPGEYLFRYLVDERTWALDPAAHGIRRTLDGVPKSRAWRPPLRLDPGALAA